VGGKSSENIHVPFLESLRMVLVISSHYKYVQLSSCNHGLPTSSRIGVVMTLVFKLWPSIIIVRRKHVSFQNMLFMLHCGLQQ